MWFKINCTSSPITASKLRSLKVEAMVSAASPLSALVSAWTCLAKPSGVLFGLPPGPDPTFFFTAIEMDIFNRPPSISEDTLHYTIYSPLDSSDKASVTALAASISSQVNAMLPNFVWHRDAFEIKLVEDQERTGSWILEGRMRVGDSVDDEWCTVWLLKEISSKWDVAIRHVFPFIDIFND